MELKDAEVRCGKGQPSNTYLTILSPCSGYRITSSDRLYREAWKVTYQDSHVDDEELERNEVIEGMLAFKEHHLTKFTVKPLL